MTFLVRLVCHLSFPWQQRNHFCGACGNKRIGTKTAMEPRRTCVVGDRRVIKHPPISLLFLREKHTAPACTMPPLQLSTFPYSLCVCPQSVEFHPPPPSILGGRARAEGGGRDRIDESVTMTGRSSSTNRTCSFSLREGRGKRAYVLTHMHAKKKYEE